MKKYFQFLSIILLATSVLAQPGSLDNSFGTNGKVNTGFGRSEAYGNSVAVQPDGKILCAGTTYTANTTREYQRDSYNALLIRYNPDGSRDSSFGDNGVVINKVEATGNSDGIYTGIYFIKVLADGRILTYGYQGTNVQYGGLVLTMYNSDGSVDISFGNNGFVFSVISPNSSLTPMVIQSDNKIVVLGGLYVSSTDATQNSATFFLERYNANGSLDSTFGTNGQVLTTFGAQLNNPGCLAIQADGKIIASGSRNGPLILARYNTNGSLDNTFDGDGRVITTFGTFNNSAYVDVLPNGKIQSAGTTGTSAGTHFAISQYNTNGSLDLTFDGDGRTLALFDVNDNSDRITSVSKQPDGKFLVTTVKQPLSEFDNPDDYVLRRYNTDGTVDNTFGINGKSTTALGLGSLSKNTATQTDGKIILVGNSKYLLGPVPAVVDFNVLRYNSNGILDPSFNEDGIISEKIESSNDNGRIVLKQNDGKLLLIGVQKYNALNTIGNSEIAMARYNQDGSLDNSFGLNGKSTFAFGQQVNSPRTAALQSDGKILVLNEFSVFTSTSGQEVIRFNSDGSLDSSFGINGKVSISTSFVSPLTALKILEDGSFLVLNHGLNPMGNPENLYLIIRHFNSNGFLDNGFGNNGFVYLEGIFLQDPNNLIQPIIIQPSGKIIIAIYQQNATGTQGIGLIRLNSNGSIDTSFQNEIFTTDIQSSPYSIFLEPDGKIIVAGVSTAVNGNFVFNNFITVRYNADGSLDTSYGTNGVLKTFLGDQSGSLYSIIKSIQRQADRKFLVGLTMYEQNPGSPLFQFYDFAVYRFDTLGEYDNNFGNAGKVFTSFFTKYDEVFSMVLQDDHKIVLAGTTDNGTTRDFALTRLQNCINVSAEVSINLCAGDSYTVNNQTYTESGTYETTLTTAIGCDSLLTLNLTFDTLNSEIALNDNVFTALNIPQNAQLQWLNCDDDFAIITGETNPSFTTFSNGNYALETTSGNCRDTSECLLFSSLGLLNSSNTSIQLFPNPVDQALFIQNIPVNQTLKLIDSTGRIILESNSLSNSYAFDVSNFENGLYVLSIGAFSKSIIVHHSNP